ncbi:MAG TPA: carbohydrate ABC transporter permease [Ktedonobacteraceae bacterium]|nr:carbohydrate ABC transporter permease [Ktedonobacteraceae bacterium]
MAQASAQTNAATQPVAITADAKPTRRFQWYQVLIIILVIFFTLTSIGPFVFSFFSSFKTLQHILDFPPSLLPNPWTLGNYQEILSGGVFPRWLLNSGIYAFGTAILNVLFSAMAGYALSRMNFPGRNIVFITTLAVMMIPLPITLIPKYLVMNDFHLVNTYFALLLPMMAQPFSVFLMVQFMRGLPKELEESARLDGASRWRTFYQIILPLVKPALIAVIILSFQGAWNDFLWPLLVTNSQNMYTLPVGLYQFKTDHYTEYNLLIAGSMFNAIPILVLFFIFQRYFMGSAVGSAVKG